MNTVIGSIAALLTLWLVWRLFVVPRLPSIRVGDHRFSMHEGQVKIVDTTRKDGNFKMAPAHLMKTSKSVCQQREKRTIYLYMHVTTQLMSNETLLMNTPNFRFVNGEPYNGYTQRLCPTYLVPASPGSIRAAERWLRRRGLRKNIDTREHEEHFNARTGAALAAFRKQFNYKEGDLDCVGFSVELEPLSYAKLTPDNEALFHSVKTGLAIKKPLSHMSVGGQWFRSTKRVAFFYIHEANKDYNRVPISKAMQDRVEADMATKGLAISWPKEF